MNGIERLRVISDIALHLQSQYTTSSINIFLGNFGISNTGETIVPSKRIYVENKLSNVSNDVLKKIAKELNIDFHVYLKEMSTHEKLEIKEKIIAHLSQVDISIIDLILDEYNTRQHYHEDFDSIPEYIKFRISEMKSAELINLLEYLNKRKDKNGIPDFWKDSKIRVFISHLSKDKEKASRLSAELLKYNIDSFVAHEDIEPNEEWLIKIEEALMSMDILIALVTKGFRDSNWTAQEIGFALGRGIPVISIKNGMDPFGFFGKKQAISGNGRFPKDITRDIVDILKKLPEFSSEIKNGV